MSLLVLNDISHRILRYDRKAFPRVAQLQDKLKRLKELEFGDVFSQIRSYDELVGDPYVILCFANDEQLLIDSNDFVVKVIDNNQMGWKSDLNLKHVVSPAVIICILDCSVDGNLTKQDVSLLNNLEHLPRHYLQNMLFLTGKSEKSLGYKEYHSLSEQINLELKINSETNNIFHRIFPHRSKELPIRLSVTLEDQVLMHLRDEMVRIEKEINGTLEHLSTTLEIKDILKESFLDDKYCQNYLRDASKMYSLHGRSYTYSVQRVDEVKTSVRGFVCEQLVAVIMRSLMCHFDKFEKPGYEMEKFILQKMDLPEADFNQDLLQFFLSSYFRAVRHINIFFWGVDLNAVDFRHKIADEVYFQLLKHRPEIIEKIFYSLKNAYSETTMLFSALIESLDLKIRPLEDINDYDSAYHILRILSQRNRLICRFGYESGRMCVFVKDVEKDGKEVDKYLSLYMDSARNVDIRQYKKLKIRPILVHQSGDKVMVPNMQSRLQNCEVPYENGAAGGDPITNNSIQVKKMSHGSASLFLSDSDKRHYFVTCSHVTVGLTGREILVHSNNGTSHRCDRVITPSDDLDFSVVRLKPNDEPIQRGIRNKDNVHTPGKLYERDSFTVPYLTEVFMWGATSGLSIGQYVGTLEDMVDSDDDIEGAFGPQEPIDSYPYFCIESMDDTTFAKPGDSGSLISFEWQGLTAAFGLIGCDNENPNQFIANRLSDGFALIKKEISGIEYHLDQEIDLCDELSNVRLSRSTQMVS